MQQTRRQVDQLRRELDVKRVPVSTTAGDLTLYCQSHQREDVLITGFQVQKDNPFKPKSSFQCALV